MTVRHKSMKRMLKAVWCSRDPLSGFMCNSSMLCASFWDSYYCVVICRRLLMPCQDTIPLEDHSRPRFISCRTLIPVGPNKTKKKKNKNGNQTLCVCICVLLLLVLLLLGQNFHRFDFGTVGNMERYGTPGPSEYDLNLVQAPVVIFAAGNDPFAPAEVRNSPKLSNKFPNSNQTWFKNKR